MLAEEVTREGCVGRVVKKAGREGVSKSPGRAGLTGKCWGGVWGTEGVQLYGYLD